MITTLITLQNDGIIKLDHTTLEKKNEGFACLERKLVKKVRFKKC